VAIAGGNSTWLELKFRKRVVTPSPTLPAVMAKASVRYVLWSKIANRAGNAGDVEFCRRLS